MHHSFLIYLLKDVLMASNFWHTQNFEIYIFKVVMFHLWILLHLKHHQMLPWSEVQMAWSPSLSPPCLASPLPTCSYSLPVFPPALLYLALHLPAFSALCPDSCYPESHCLDLSLSDTSSEKPSFAERNPRCPITFLHKLLFWFSLVYFLLPEMVLSVCLLVSCLPTEHGTPSGSFLVMLTALEQCLGCREQRIFVGWVNDSFLGMTSLMPLKLLALPLHGSHSPIKNKMGTVHLQRSALCFQLLVGKL